MQFILIINVYRNYVNRKDHKKFSNRNMDCKFCIKEIFLEILLPNRTLRVKKTALSTCMNLNILFIYAKDNQSFGIEKK